MKTLTITEKQAKGLYPKADAEFKATLEKTFGKKTLTDKIIDQIGSFEDAYPIFKKMKFKDALYAIIQKRSLSDLTSIDKLLIIAEVLRNGWKADYRNGGQKKWWAYFEFNTATSGFGFSYAFCDGTHTYASVGSRLSFPDQETAIYFGSHKPFLKLHNEYLLTQY